jgi:hypothetical protein
MEWIIVILIFTWPFWLILGAIYIIVRWYNNISREQNKKEAETKDRWENIHTGMSKEEVEKVLGLPQQVKEPTLWRSVMHMGTTEEWSYGFLGVRLNSVLTRWLDIKNLYKHGDLNFDIVRP